MKRKITKKFHITIIAILLLIVALFTIRLLSRPEDTWLCQRGEWVKHGNPSAPKPTTLCLP